MNPVCSRHPEKPAMWLCPKCRLHFCGDCVITLDTSSIGGTQVVRFCRKCMIAAKPMGVTDVFIPFWKRIFTPSSNSPLQDNSKNYPQKTEEFRDDPTTMAVKKVDVFCRENKLDKAIDYIRHWMKSGGKMNAALAGRYSDLLIKKGQTDELRSYAPSLLKPLIAAGKHDTAIRLFDACGGYAADFTLDPAIRLKIADVLDANERSKDAIKVLGILAKSHPHAPETPMAYFRAAQIYHERLTARNRAARILEQLIQKYPTHNLLPAFKSYLDRIGK